MIKKKFKAYLCLLISINSYSQDLSYESTQKKSMSKYQRIGHIEDYLKNIETNMNKLSSNIDKKFSTGDMNILSKIDKIELSLSALKKELSRVSNSNKKSKADKEDSKNISTSDKDKILDQIELNTAKILELELNIVTINTTLKSMEEMLKVEKSSEVNN